ncbi:type III-B CRISPR module-associated protein Cmr5 [Ktedonobacter racemifer]|uniref:CRISPR type III-B/RAMP module-associated protein Cmr5 n=1 Tax=Ktedonobacter racemifer DSM 44963 TaxID=485913 RepID=D6TCX9_KTERA|nr:type III-B CRISPR module-associated protein Cmr5 [Ktedonobacter racemifer]EFH90030.1 CRISPR-associated protein, Cmr5 family [Ktedonobacter racemifer DSM 44963]
MQSTQQPTRRQTIEQRRARQAWENVKFIKDQGTDLSKKYRSLARGLNAMIQINGLGQTLAFLCAKAKCEKKENGEIKCNEHHYLSLHITRWMKDHFKAHNKDAIKDIKEGLRDWVIDEGTSASDYRRATTECLAFGTWLSRFAEAELEGEEG